MPNLQLPDDSNQDWTVTGLADDAGNAVSSALDAGSLAAVASDPASIEVTVTPDTVVNVKALGVIETGETVTITGTTTDATTGTATPCKTVLTFDEVATPATSIVVTPGPVNHN